MPAALDNSQQLTQRWSLAWPGVEPIGHVLRTSLPARWARFDAGHHHGILTELAPVGDLLIIARDWDERDVAGGWTRTLLPDAWPWRTRGKDRFSVTTRAPDQLGTLLEAVADDRADVILADSSLDWLYHPYDRGADVIARSSAERDGLVARHPNWLAH